MNSKRHAKPNETFSVWEVVVGGKTASRYLTYYEARAYCNMHNRLLDKGEARGKVVRREACVA